MDDPLPTLSATETRVLGSLVEKSITTPDYYPLSLNALTNACNQLTNREPVMSLTETDVARAIDTLREKRLASQFSGAESRVAKYKHTLADAILLTPAELALLTVLMLRGPQTIGELRTRCERLFAFDNLREAEDALSALAARTPQPLVAKLPRQPGTKESRYTHLLSGAVDLPNPAPNSTEPAESSPGTSSGDAGRIDALESQVAALRSEIDDMKEQLAAFRKQFE